MPETERPANRLIDEPSPYLQQHAHNPVDWYPWGEEAFRRAEAEDRPLFISIGYSTCHWCHVMERESFEDPEVAELINRTFVPVKVDREERPDVDQAYMTICGLLTGSGGWPLTIVATPQGRPFFAATYIPKTARFGRAGMLELIPRLDAAWKERRTQLERYADQVTAWLRKSAAGAAGDTPAGPPGGIGAAKAPGETSEGAAGVPRATAGEAAEWTRRTEELIEQAYTELQAGYDPVHGGFGFRPKFPTPHHLTFLLRYWLRTGEETALEMVETTLRAMGRGGIFDHLGFGFHRYSTDERWLLPHFEKMLYDQAMLVIAYAEAYQATGRAEYRDTAEKVIAYVERRLTGPEGEFYSAEDADSEGEEGRFYVWTEAEIREVLGPELAGSFIEAYGVKAEGNYNDEAGGRRSGHNVLHLAGTPETGPEDSPDGGRPRTDLLAGARTALFRSREKRAYPLRDDKVLTDWNGLMIAALGRAARGFRRPEHAMRAMRAADFLLEEMDAGRGRLLHRYRAGQKDIEGYLDDYAFFIWGLLELYEATFEPRWLREAVRLSRVMIELFEDRRGGGFFFTAAHVPTVLVRNKELQDGAVPAGNSVAVSCLLRLARMTADVSFEETAARAAEAAVATARRAPSAFTQLLGALDFALGPTSEVVVAGVPGRDDTKAMLAVVQRPIVPNKVVIFRPDPAGKGKAGDDPAGAVEITRLAPFTESLRAVDGKATAYVCQGFQCNVPVTDPEKAAAQLAAIGSRKQIPRAPSMRMDAAGKQHSFPRTDQG